MSIKEIIMSSDNTMSFEVFPPREENRMEVLYKIQAIAILASNLGHSYISVTHRLGTTFENTIEACKVIKSVAPSLPVVAHMTTVYATKEEVLHRIELCKEAGVDAILALRGDFPDNYDVSKSDFKSSLDLIKFIKKNSDLEVGASFYPEGYDRDDSLLYQFNYMHQKELAGADFLVSQMVFSSDKFYGVRKAFIGYEPLVSIPMVPGILPVLTKKSLDRTLQSNVTIPPKIHASYFKEDPEYIRTFGKLYFKSLIFEMYTSYCNHVHLYTMNNVGLVKEVVEEFKGYVK